MTTRSRSFRAVARSSRPAVHLNVVLTAGQPDRAMWGIAQTTRGFRVVQRARATDGFHTVSLPWPTLEAAQVDMHARMGH